jgi:hypothetical protein
MSPVDSSAVEPLSLDPAATAKLEHGKSSKRNSEAVVEVRVYVFQSVFTYSKLYRIIHRTGRNQK